MSAVEFSRRAKMAISHLLNPSTPSRERFDGTDNMNGHRRSSPIVQGNSQAQQSRAPQATTAAQNEQLESGIGPLFNLTFEIPTVPAQLQSHRPRNVQEFARYPLLAAFISSKLVSRVNFQRPFPSSETFSLVVRETHERIYSALCELNCTTRVILSALLYVLRIFPESIPYSGTQDRHCVNMLSRLFLLGSQLSIVWFHDSYADLDNWSYLMGLSSRHVIRFEREALQVLDYMLFISPLAWNEFLKRIHEDCSMFLTAGDVEDLRLLVDSLHIHVSSALVSTSQLDSSCHSTEPERELPAASNRHAELDRRRVRIAECAVQGKISKSSDQEFASARIEDGTEADRMFDAFDQGQETLFDELREYRELYPPLPQSRLSSPISLSPIPLSNESISTAGAGIFQETFAPPVHSTPHMTPCSESSAYPPLRSPCISPTVKIEEIEPKLVWPSSSSPNKDALAEDQGCQHITRREPLEQLDLPSSPDPESQSAIPNADTVPESTLIAVARCNAIQKISSSEMDTVAKPRSSKHIQVTVSSEQAQFNLDTAPEMLAADVHVFQTPPARLIDSLLFSLSPLTPLPSIYYSGAAAEENTEMNLAYRADGDVSQTIQTQGRGYHVAEEQEEEESEESDDSSRYGYDWDSDSDDSESLNVSSSSPPPFRIPDTYDKETGLWITPSERTREDEGEPFDPVAYFTSMACTSDVEDESFYSPYGAPRWQVEPMSIGEQGFSDSDSHRNRARLSHPVDVEAEVISRESFSMGARGGREHALAPLPLCPFSVQVDLIPIQS